MATRRLEELDPQLALLPGKGDAAILLVLWCARKTFFPLIWLGATLAIIGFGDVGRLEAELGSLEDPMRAIGNLLSPLGGLVVALVIRVATNVMAFLAAFRLTAWTRDHQYVSGRRLSRWLRSWWDRVYLTRAYRSLRWTGVVREAAHVRLGESSRVFDVAITSLRWAGVTLFLAMLVTIGLSPPV